MSKQEQKPHPPPQAEQQQHHQGQWEQGVGGYLQFRVWSSSKEDTRRWHLPDPPDKVIPIIFLPGIMGSNLRMSKQRQHELKRDDNRAWRPDDLQAHEVVAGIGYGGAMRKASARERQLQFDPDNTEVEYYHYSERADMFDPDGEETKASDARHQNLPDSFAAIPPLLTNAKPAPAAASMREKMQPLERAAQKARWRGWSEVMYGEAYGQLLRTTEAQMNNILSTTGQPPQVRKRWQGRPTGPIAARPLTQQYADHPDGLAPYANSPQLQQLLRAGAAQFGATQGAAISDDELRRIGHCWYPVHAMGYNWLKSNGDNAKTLAPRIRELIAMYRKRDLRCEQVILVTHSMGGLLARALIHPRYGNLQQQVLGIYHSAMPTHGAAAAYKRIRCGFEGGWPVANILGKDGPNVTCVLANAPGGLELLPNTAYGTGWLKLVDPQGKLLMEMPAPQYENYEKHFMRDNCKLHPELVGDIVQRCTAEATPERDIYLKPETAWWRLINPQWVNPAKPDANLITVMDDTHERIDAATEFHRSIAKTFHPVTYASYCDSSSQMSYGEIVWKVQSDVNFAHDGPPQQWSLVSEDGAGKLVVQTKWRRLTLTLQEPTASGDGTVPAERSAEKVAGFKFAHSRDNNRASYSHQDSCAHPEVLASTLYAIVKIASKARWWDQ